jgi:hypothetical protein
VPPVLTTFTSSAWNAGGSIMTFYFPIGLFLVVATLLYLVLTRPHTVPGRKPLTFARPAGAADTAQMAVAPTGAAGEDAEPVATSADHEAQAPPT